MSHPYRVTVLVALYKAGRFLDAKLQSLRQQSIFDKCQVVLLVCQNHDGEYERCLAFQQQHPDNAFCVYRSEYQRLYAAWNTGLAWYGSKAPYVTNSNVDDMLHPQCFEKLADALDRNPEHGVAMSNSYVTGKPNSLWPDWRTHHGIIETIYPLGTPGPGPMWRYDLHRKLGWFPECRTIGDALFWHRLHENGVKFLNVPEILISYYQESGHNLETRVDQVTGRPLRDMDLEEFQ